MEYDVIIVGGGSAGLTCAIYTARENLKTLVIDKGPCGGLAGSTDLIENYPGFPEGVSGPDLMNKFKEQAKRFGTRIVEFKEIKNIKNTDKTFILSIDNEEYRSKSVVLATGSVPKQLNLPGEKEFKGKGVSYCATCDGPLFKGKEIAIVGCGNSGLQEGEALLKYVKKVNFIEFLPKMTAQKVLQDRLQKEDNTEFFLNHKLVSINGNNFVESVTVEDRKNNQAKKISVQGVFIYAGYLPNSGFVKDLVKLDKDGYILTDEHMTVSVPGIFAVGDVRAKDIRQIDVACAEGTIAAVAVRDYLNAL